MSIRAVKPSTRGGIKIIKRSHENRGSAAAAEEGAYFTGEYSARTILKGKGPRGK